MIDPASWTPEAMLEILLENPDDFLKVRETLTRIGVASHHEKRLFQSAHILHKKGKYYLVHFKELFLLDGKPANLTEEDLKRRNTIATLLADWGLLTIKGGYPPDEDRAHLRKIKIIRHSEKDQWELVPKYQIGSPQ
jgi:hypothetical protein